MILLFLCILFVQIAANSAADRSRKLRIGDRILRVNDVNVENTKHAVAVEVR